MSGRKQLGNVIYYEMTDSFLPWCLLTALSEVSSIIYCYSQPTVLPWPVFPHDPAAAYYRHSYHWSCRHGSLGLKRGCGMMLSVYIQQSGTAAGKCDVGAKGRSEKWQTRDWAVGNRKRRHKSVDPSRAGIHIAALLIILDLTLRYLLMSFLNSGKWFI